jgi:hypothetical protein
MQRQLVERARRGDADAFGELFHEASRRLHAITYRILRDPDRALTARDPRASRPGGRAGVALGQRAAAAAVASTMPCPKNEVVAPSP